MAPTQRAPRRQWKLADHSYAISTPEYQRQLAAARERFHKVVNEEVKTSGKKVSPETRARWVVSEDFGRLRELWEMGYNPRRRGVYAPLVGHDIITLQNRERGLPAREPALFSKKEHILEDMMHPKDAYAFPVPDRNGRYVATVVHVGPEASSARMRKLAKSLIKNPTAQLLPPGKHI